MTEYECKAVIDSKEYSLLTINCHNTHQAQQQFGSYLRQVHDKNIIFASEESYTQVELEAD